jgi:hypothetical protein
MRVRAAGSHLDFIERFYAPACLLHLREATMNRRMVKILSGIAALFLLALAGAAIARGTGAFDDGDESATGPQAERARAAALSITRGGTANAVERDSEGGGTWEVEVTRKDGSTVDVRLDASFKLVAIDGDSEANDSEGE